MRFAILTVALVLSSPLGVAHADRLGDLSRRLSRTKSDKARVAAAVSLGRLEDKRALKPLVTALRDKNNMVRAVAASALGTLGDSRGLPALRRATLDKDVTVRKRATQAIGAIRKDGERAGPNGKSRYNLKSRKIREAHYRVDARESPRMSPRKPDLYVTVRTAADQSRGRASKAERKKRGDLMRNLLVSELRKAKRLTTSAFIAEDLELPFFAIDISITRLKRVVRGPWVELECELRIAISNESGKMISFLTSGAKVQVPKRSFRKQYEPNMRKEALKNAVTSVHTDLVRYLLKTSGV
ncbi:MAG: HEAT repeat domain-containing protein [Myxococcales bacterium]|nr:HEAT repeat domain-containing protein [Myxococcales bacterium]